jgi:hypothetical protein
MQQTFKARVQQFWKWFEAEAPRISRMIDDGHAASLASEMSAHFDAMLAGPAWEFGESTGSEMHELTLTGEGNRHMQFLTAYWKSMAPAIAGWTFHAARQPSKNPGARPLQLGDKEIKLPEFLFAPTINDESQQVDLRLWHPDLSDLPEREQWLAIFIALDELLGEFGVQQWIGAIDLSDKPAKDARSISELPSYIKQVAGKTGWEKQSPLESFTTYEFPQPHNAFPRGDIMIGTTCHPVLLSEYLHAEGEMPDPLENTGADYVWVQLARSVLPEGRETEMRQEIEEQLEQALEQQSAGRLLGGALGAENAYIDLLIFDGANSVGIIQNVLLQRGLHEGASLEYFASSKRLQRVVF